MKKTAERMEEGTPNDHWRCLCHKKRVLIKFNGGNGMTLCAVTREALFSGFPPGWRAKAEADQTTDLHRRFKEGEISEEQYVAHVRGQAG